MLVLHAAGTVSQFLWRICNQRREICHCSAPKWIGAWEDEKVRNAAIGWHVFTALAGGAWEAVLEGRATHQASLEEIHRLAGAIDFELAHEWLTLQRYDGDQAAIELDIQRLFNLARRYLEAERQRRSVELLAERLLAAIAHAEREGRMSLSLPAHSFLLGIEANKLPPIRLEATIR